MPLEGQLLGVIDRRWEAGKVGARLTTEMFHHGAGRPVHVSTFSLAGDRGRRAAGHPTKLLNDMRRTFARNETNAGTPQHVTMKKGGWKSDAVFRRYAIVALDDMPEAMAQRGEARLAYPNPDSSRTIGCHSWCKCAE